MMRRLSRQIVAAALLLGCIYLYWLAPALYAQTLPSPPSPSPNDHLIVKGILVTPDGRPLPQATISFLADPDNPAWRIGAYETVTDARGRFVWSVMRNAGPSPEEVLAHALKTLDPSAALTAPGRSLNSYDFWKCAIASVRGANPFEVKIVAPAIGSASITVRDPNGKPLQSHDVTLIRRSVSTNFSGQDFVTAARTDAQGRLTMRSLTPDLMHIQVLAPGVGFGSTGVFLLKPNVTVTPAMPPMIRLAQLSGTVSAQLRTPTTVVTCKLFTNPSAWTTRQASIDPQGRYLIPDVIPGEYSVGLSTGDFPNQLAMLVSGQRRSDVDFGTPGFPTAVSRTVLFYNDGSRKSVQDVALSVHGQITDTSGKPLAGADVYEIYAPYNLRTDEERFNGSHGMSNDRLASTRTDADGRYRFPARDSDSLMIAAHSPGHIPLGVDVPAALPSKGTVLWTVDQSLNIQLPVSTDKLVVRATKSGQSVGNALVQVTPTPDSQPNDVVPDDHFYRLSKQLPQLFEPTATTGANGEATFTDLKPGNWDCYAVSSARAADLAEFRSSVGSTFHTNIYTHASASALSVQSGHTTNFELALLSDPAAAVIQLRLPDNGSPDVQGIGYVADLPNERTQGTGTSPEPNGCDTIQTDQPGVWHIATGQTPLGLASGESFWPPVYVGQTYLAFSAALAHPRAQVILPYFGEGTISVRLIDSSGKPVRGAVLVVSPFTGIRSAGSTDSQGRIVFTDLPEGDFTLEASDYSGNAFLNTEMYLAWIEGSSALTSSEFQVQSGYIRLGDHLNFTMQDIKLKQITGKLLLPTGSNSSDYIIQVTQGTLNSVEAAIDSKTGNFTASPLLPGPVLALLKRVPTSGAPGEGSLVLAVSFTVTDKTPPVIVAPGPEPSQNALRLTVFEPDGKTPAWPARVMLSYPGTPELGSSSATGLDGTLLAQNIFVGELAVPGNRKIWPKVIAWLPGSYGAIMQEYVPGQPQKLVLPPSVGLHGSIRIDGKPLTGEGKLSSYEVRAEYESGKDLSDALSVTVAAQPDGSFDIGGLTAGTYTLQAARDGVWLSKPQTLVVKRGVSPEPVALDIPPPGAPAVLHLRSSRGAPLAGIRLTPDIPAGPLSTLLWPKELVTDADGDLTLDGLAAGKHRLRIAGSESVATFTLQPLSASGKITVVTIQGAK